MTGREIQVLRAVSIYGNNRQTAAVLNTCETTVRVHMTHIMTKFHVPNRILAVTLAIKMGLVLDPFVISKSKRRPVAGRKPRRGNG